MSNRIIPRRALLLSLALALTLPIGISVLWGLSVLLGQMGDPSGSMVASRVALVLAALWVINLIGLVLMQAIISVDDRGES